jgi:hypothetical protein
VVEEADEVGDGALEVDVILPQRVVGVDQQRLTWRIEGHTLYVSESEQADSRRSASGKQNQEAKPVSFWRIYPDIAPWALGKGRRNGAWAGQCSETRVAVSKGKPAEWLFSQEKATLNTVGKGTLTLVSL